MSAPDILNLDEIKGHHRAIKLNGEEYPLEDLSVNDFITTLRESEEIDKRLQGGEELSVTDQMEMHIASIRRLIPTLPEEVLGKLSVQQLGAIIQFAQDSAQEGAPETSDENTEGKEQGTE